MPGQVSGCGGRAAPLDRGVNRPFRLPLLRACAVLLLALAGLCTGAGQDAEKPETRDPAKALSARDPLPELPVSGLLDEGSVFRDADSAMAAADIEDFRKRVGLPLFVVTANYIFGDTVENYGERLVREKLQGRSGVIMLYERGSGQLQYSASPGALGKVEDMRALFLISSKAAAFLPDEATAAQRLRAAVQALTTAAEHWKTKGELPPAPASPAPLPADPPKKEELPDAPLDYLLDLADAFEPNTEAAFKAELQKFHAEHDMDVYVVTNIYLSQGTAQTMAEKLAQKWLLDRYGAVLVMNRGTGPKENALGIALSPDNEKVVPGSALMQAVTDAQAKSEEVLHQPDGSRAAGVRAAALVLMETFATHGDAARAANRQVTSSGQWTVMTGMAAALLLGALALFGFHQVQERLERRSNEQFRFPDVTVGRRLGAVQGGGNVAGVSFGRKPPR